MKKQILTILTCLASITAFAQTTEINLSLSAVETASISKVNGYLVWSDQISTKSSALITDSCVVLTDDIGKETKYRVLTTSTGFTEPTIKLFVINDLSGKFYNIEFFTTDNNTTAAVLHISNMESVIHYTGSKL